MSDLFWPGDERAGDLFSQPALLAAMLGVETAWLEALAGAGIAPAAAAVDLGSLIGPDEVAEVAESAETVGNPVVGMLGVLRERLDSPAREWLHRGLTSQDVVDTALMLCARDVLARLATELGTQISTLAELSHAHRGTVMAGRTLTQYAVPITFGLKAAQWLSGLLEARDQLGRILTPIQVGGAAGTLAATVELARASGTPDPVKTALALTSEVSRRLGLADASPWHTERSSVTRLGDALVSATDAWGHVANDVLALSRPEIAELTEPTGRGGSSTMPHKANPILSVLIRRASLAAPGQAAQLHLAAAAQVDERAEGGWHLEWSTLATLARRTVVAASQASELMAGLGVDAARMHANAESALTDLLAEQRAFNPDATGGPTDYLGANHVLIDAVLDRARTAIS
jgi:3-carboxy-cis,cis-muconate cycloisomerase